MSFGGIPFGESTFAGPVLAGVVTGGPPAENPIDVIIDPYTIEIAGQSMKGHQLIDSLSIDAELGRQATARFTLLNMSPVPEIGTPVRILFYSNVLFVGAIDSLSISTNNMGTYITYDIECTDNSYLLFRRKIKRSFSNQTVTNIALNVIGLDLSGDGITLGSVHQNFTLPVADADGVSAYEFLNGIAVATGTILQITENKVINFIGAFNQQTGGTLDEDNVEQCDLKFDRETYRNRNTCTVTGTAVGGTPVTVSFTRDNTDQITQRAAIEGNSGIYSEFVALTHPTSNDTTQLTRLANSYNKVWLGLAGSIRRSLTIRTRQFGWKAGQQVSVDLPLLGIDGTWIIQRCSMREESGRFLIYTLELSQSTLMRRALEMWVDVVKKGTVSVLPPIAIYTNTQSYTTPGTYTFIVPDLITEIQITCGAGGGGGGGAAMSEWPAYGGIVNAAGSRGGNGGLSIAVIPVSPGEAFTVKVGAGGGHGAGDYKFETFTDAFGGHGSSGGESWVKRNGTTYVTQANGGIYGRGGTANARNQYSSTLPPGEDGTANYGQANTVGGGALGGRGGYSYSHGGPGVSGNNGYVYIEY